MRDLHLRWQLFIGWLLYHLGVPYNVSSGIAGEVTYGYGRLDNNGYWEYPCYPDTMRTYAQRRW